MKPERKEFLLENLGTRRNKVLQYLTSRAEGYAQYSSIQHIRDAANSYILDGGKFLRAVVLLFSCGAVEGNEEIALPAAAAVEAFHTWTLVHDDIIDQDAKRRGKLSVHEEYRRKAAEVWGLNDLDAKHYGQSVGILAGDILQGWVVSFFYELYRERNVDQDVVLYLINDLNLRVRSLLIDGEMMDVQLPQIPLEGLGEDAIIQMLWKKTAVLYEFAGQAGAMIGLNTDDPTHPLVSALASFTGKCGIAFQLQDDVLGMIGDERLLGKSTRSDINQGKRTLVNYYALKHAKEEQKETLLRVLGNKQATTEEIQEAKILIKQIGGLEYCGRLAESYLKEALAHLDRIPASTYKDLLSIWAEYMIEREF